MVGQTTEHTAATDRTNGFKKVPLPPDLNREIPLTDNARTVLRKRYLRRGDDGQPVETEQEMFWRVAYHVAKTEAEHGGEIEPVARQFYDLLTSLRFFPNSPTFTGAGTPLGQLAACFVLKIDDDMGRTGSGIFETLRHAALIQQTGGGNGFSFSSLRPKGALVKSSSGLATGPVGFLRVYDQAFGEIAQGGCVTGDTLVATAQGGIPIRDLVGQRPLVYTYDPVIGQHALRHARDVRLTGRGRKVYRLRTADGFTLTATADHPIMLPDGAFRPLGELARGETLMAFAGLGPVADVTFVGYEDVYDLEVPGTHNFAVVDGSRGGRGVYIHNSRRGANMAVLRVDHPDIRDFITCKTDENAITNFNISVGVTDAFMQAVIEDSDFDLVNPQDGTVWETVRARELFDLIVKQAHHNGEPGVLFLDTANAENPVPHLYTLESTNPCGEQFLGPFENCCLGSINLAQHVTEDQQVDWEKLREAVVLSTRFLEDVVSANAYVPAVPQLEEAAHRVRRIGLGIMGLADMMYALGVRYGSTTGQEFASQVMEFVRFHAMQTSIDLAKERGPFPAITGSLYDPADLKWQPPKPLVPYSHDWGCPELDWSQIVAGIKAHGIRNGAQLTIAPTGTISTVAGIEGYGCEPVFALAYTRYVNDADRQITLQYTSPLFERALRDAGLDDAAIGRIVEKVNSSGTCQHIEEVPPHIRETFVVSSDVAAEEHVRMQAALQAFTDNAISKTINFPADTPERDVADAYRLAWELGCKGLTVYVTGSREKVVLETAATKQQKESGVPVVEQPRLFNEEKKPRPRYLSGKTYRVQTPLGTTYVTVNENGEGKGQPFEVFMHTAKAGSETAAVSEAMGRLISYVLRLTSTVSPRSRLREVVRQLESIGGVRAIGFGPSRVSSLPDGVAQVLQEYLTESEAQVGHPADVGPYVPENQLPLELPPSEPRELGDLCPECGAATLVNEEGCRKCYSCGFSEC